MSIKFKGGHKRGSLARWWQRAHERARLLGLGPISCIDITSSDGSSVLTLSGGEDDLVSLAASIYGNPIRYQLPAMSALEADMEDAQQTDLTPSHLLEALEGQPLTTLEADMAEAAEAKTTREQAIETITPCCRGGGQRGAHQARVDEGADHAGVGGRRPGGREAGSVAAVTCASGMRCLQ